MIASFSGSYRFLSNFYPTRIHAFDLVFPTAEHAYQAAKTLDKNKRIVIANARTPSEAKKLGRALILRPNWDEVKLKHMRMIVWIKFHDSPCLRQMLLDTDDEQLVEGNSWNDFYWGVCNGIGQNQLGKTLMKVREELRK